MRWFCRLLFKHSFCAGYDAATPKNQHGFPYGPGATALLAYRQVRADAFEYWLQR